MVQVEEIEAIQEGDSLLIRGINLSANQPDDNNTSKATENNTENQKQNNLGTSGNSNEELSGTLSKLSTQIGRLAVRLETQTDACKYIYH